MATAPNLIYPSPFNLSVPIPKVLENAQKVDPSISRMRLGNPARSDEGCKNSLYFGICHGSESADIAVMVIKILIWP